ncbi:MAG: hypothetical protein ACI9XO_001575 [Paraglaciecola sp.]|jgi:hypothetical protein
MTATETIQKVKLVNGNFSPSEASDAMRNLIQGAINFNKTNRLKLLIEDEGQDTSSLCGNIDSLCGCEETANNIIAEARKSGQKVAVKAFLKVSIVE